MISKMTVPKSPRTIRYERPIGILILGTMCFCLVGMKDSVWTYAFWRHPWPEYTNFMSRSLFEGDWPGGSDLGVVIPILAFWYWLRIRGKSVRADLAKSLKFVFTCGIIGSGSAVQLIKLSVSRARPKVFESEVLAHLNVDPASIWLPGYMGWDGPRGYSWNSFPSGHAGSCAFFIALVYLIPRHRQIARSITASTVIVATMLMAIARSMAGMHWLSDSVASFFIVWAAVDLIAQYQLDYFRVPRVNHENFS